MNIIAHYSPIAFDVMTYDKKYCIYIQCFCQGEI
nr:MAG TPA: hypothetical protein [Bacteriophage sp.]